MDPAISRNKGGRPPLPEDQRKELVTIFLQREVLGKLRVIARREGATISQTARRLLSLAVEEGE